MQLRRKAASLSTPHSRFRTPVLPAEMELNEGRTSFLSQV